MSVPSRPVRRHPPAGTRPGAPAPAVPRADPLTQVLDGLRLRCMLPGAHEMTAPWGVQFGRIDPSRVRRHMEAMGLPVRGSLPTVHGEIVAVLQGNCCLEVPSCNIRRTLAGGDVVLVLRKDAFILRDDWQTPVREVQELRGPESLEHGRGLSHGGGGASTTLLTGPFFFEDAEDHPLLAALPPVMHVRGDESHVAPWLQSTLTFINSELTALLPGFQSIVNHLAHALFVQAVRAYAASLPEESPGNWFRAISDADLAPALGAMHARPEEPWTVATLAEEAGVSRSVFAARFTSVMGEPPLHYLTECRMRKAKALLLETRLGIKTIAAKVGYSNESAFSNAFRRAARMSPGDFRHLDPERT